MIEIETKAHIESIADIKIKLESQGFEFAPPKSQHDIIYFEANDDVEGLWLHKTVLRIREVNGVSTVTLKQHRADDGDQFNCLELASEVKDPEQMGRILEILGFEPKVQVSKIRLQAKQESLSVCLDDVEGLGSFIEVEMLFEEDADIDDAFQKKAMQDFMHALGISENQFENHGYDMMIWRKRLAA